MNSPLPLPEEKAAKVEAMFDRIAPGYERVNRYISFGQDRRWRDRTVKALALPKGSVILDLACGTGDLCRDLQSAGFAPIGIDFSAGMLANAKTTAPLVRGDALRLPIPSATVDGITCGFALRNFTGLEPFFAEAYKYLPASTAYLPEPEAILAMARAAGFKDLKRTTMTLGAVQLIEGTRS